MSLLVYTLCINSSGYQEDITEGASTIFVENTIGPVFSASSVNFITLALNRIPGLCGYCLSHHSLLRGDLNSHKKLNSKSEYSIR